VWDAQTGKELRTLRGHTDPVWCVCLSGDDQYIVSGGDDHTVKVWDAPPPGQN
jgi:WD40 repeat protein